MADHSAIQWTEATWNPTVGCSLKSAGCTNCYAMSLAHRLGERMKKEKYRGTTKIVGGRPVWNGLVRADKYSLADPLCWHKPRMIFVDSMSDLFHGELAIEEIAKVFGIMALCPQHTFQVLTKRPERMCDLMHELTLDECLEALASHEPPVRMQTRAKRVKVREMALAIGRDPDEEIWPLENVWLGTSIEDQRTADKWGRELMKLWDLVPVLFLSAEPLLGHVAPLLCQVVDGRVRRTIDWVIVGGESGPNRRPCDPAWIESIVRQCREAGVPCYVKQDAGPRPGMQGRLSDEIWAVKEFPVVGALV